MEIMSFKRHTVSECEYCGALLVVPSAPDVSAIVEKYDEHLRDSQKCREWHSALPTLQDVRDAMRPNAKVS